MYPGGGGSINVLHDFKKDSCWIEVPFSVLETTLPNQMCAACLTCLGGKEADGETRGYNLIHALIQRKEKVNKKRYFSFSLNCQTQSHTVKETDIRCETEERKCFSMQLTEKICCIR